MQNNYSNSVQYGGFFVRAGAHVIDMMIVAVITLIVRFPLWIISSGVPENIWNARILFSYTIKDILLYFCAVFYYVLLTYFTGATIGKKLMNLKVIKANGEKLSLWNVIYRETIGRFLCTFAMGIGYIMAGIDKEKRGIHDILSDTRVIYARSATIPESKQRQMPKHPDYQMRRKDREVVENAKINEIIAACDCCRLGLCDEGKAYIVPLNFGYEEINGKKTFYFHGASQGRKIDLIQKTHYAGFELDTNYELQKGETVCEFSTKFQSVIGEGKVQIIRESEEKKYALQRIMYHNSQKDDWEFPEDMLVATTVFKLEVEKISCKEHL